MPEEVTAKEAPGTPETKKVPSPEPKKVIEGVFRWFSRSPGR